MGAGPYWHGKGRFQPIKIQPLTALPISPGPGELGKAALQNMVRRDADSSRVWLRALALLRSSRTLLLPGTWEKRTGSHGALWNWSILSLPAQGSSIPCERAHHTGLLDSGNLGFILQFQDSWPLPGTLLPGCPTSFQNSFLCYILYETVSCLSEMQL